MCIIRCDTQWYVDFAEIFFFYIQLVMCTSTNSVSKFYNIKRNINYVFILSIYLFILYDRRVIYNRMR